jgi:hypothetical protein
MPGWRTHSRQSPRGESSSHLRPIWIFEELAIPVIAIVDGFYLPAVEARPQSAKVLCRSAKMLVASTETPVLKGWPTRVESGSAFAIAERRFLGDHANRTGGVVR